MRSRNFSYLEKKFSRVEKFQVKFFNAAKIIIIEGYYRLAFGGGDFQFSDGRVTAAPLKAFSPSYAGLQIPPCVCVQIRAVASTVLRSPPTVIRLSP